MKHKLSLLLSIVLIMSLCAYAEEAWACPTCGITGNTGLYCGKCGTPKPGLEAWTCPTCGHEGNVGNFCPYCAAAKPEPDAAGNSDEPTVRYQEVFSAYSISNTDAEADGHSLFKVMDRKGLYGIMNDIGETLIPYQFDRLSHEGNVYFSIREGDELNNQALINSNGEQLTKFQYADFVVLDENWVLGIKITPATGELYDYSGWSSGKYLIYSVDVYDFSRRSLVGNFLRQEYKRAKVIDGQYLLVLDRNDKVQLYDKNLRPIESGYTDFYQDELYITTVGFEKCVVSRINGGTITKGISSISSISNSNLYWAKGETSKSSWNSGWGLMDKNGKLLTGFDYTSSVSGNYGGFVKVSNGDKVGLLRLSDGKLVIPAEYDDILRSDGNYEFVNNGYAAVVKDGKAGFVDLKGNVTCEPKYAKAAVTILGCTMYATDLDGSIILIAADGTVTRDIQAIYNYGGSDDGYFLSVQSDAGKWGIVDWHGKTVIPFIAEYHFSVLGNGYVIYNDTLYNLVR